MKKGWKKIYLEMIKVEVEFGVGYQQLIFNSLQNCFCFWFFFFFWLRDTWDLISPARD